MPGPRAQELLAAVHDDVVDQLLLDGGDPDGAHLPVGVLDVVVAVYRPEGEPPPPDLIGDLVYEGVRAAVLAGDAPPVLLSRRGLEPFAVSLLHDRPVYREAPAIRFHATVHLSGRRPSCRLLPARWSPAISVG